MVPTAEIDLGEEAHPLELIQEFIDHRNWKLCFTMFSFNSLKSTPKRQVSSCFLTNNTGAEKGDMVARIIP
jgi:hypothetical protein